MKDDQKRRELIITIAGVILGLSIAFLSQWSNSPDPKSCNPEDSWKIYHLIILIPMWLGEILIASSILFGLKKINPKKSYQSTKHIYNYLLFGISLLIFSQIFSYLLEIMVC